MELSVENFLRCLNQLYSRYTAILILMQRQITNICSVRIGVLHLISETSLWNRNNHKHCDETSFKGLNAFFWSGPSWYSLWCSCVLASEARTQENHKEDYDGPDQTEARTQENHKEDYDGPEQTEARTQENHKDDYDGTDQTEARTQENHKEDYDGPTTDIDGQAQPSETDWGGSFYFVWGLTHRSAIKPEQSMNLKYISYSITDFTYVHVTRRFSVNVMHATHNIVLHRN